MVKKTQYRSRVKQLALQLNIAEFNALTDVLFELYKENYSACAKLLGISRHTFKRWEKVPPTWPYWNVVLRHVIKHTLAGIIQKRGATAKHKKRILAAFNAIPDSTAFADEINNLAYNNAAAETHLRRLLSPGGMFFDEICKAANSGGFDEKTLRRAARNLQIVKTQEGYGEHKRSFWRLPTEDDE